MNITSKDINRFFGYVNVSGPIPDQRNPHYYGLEACHEWKTQPMGKYPQFRVCGKSAKAHRVAWTIKNGEIPKGLSVLHRCDNRRCVNPDHLFVGTILDNVRDMIVKNRAHRASGSSHGTKTKPESVVRGNQISQSKLQDEQVLEIRNIYTRGNTSQQAIADRFKIAQHTVSLIVRRKIWTHI